MNQVHEYERLIDKILNPVTISDMIARIHPGVQISSCSAGEIMRGTATKIRYTVTYNEVGEALGLPTTLVAKGGLHADRNRDWLYAYEARFFRELQPTIGINCPTAVGIGGTPAHVVLLEDLDRRGVRFCRVQTPISVTEARAFLEVLARLHASHWASSRLVGGDLDNLRDRLALPPPPIGHYPWSQLEPENWAHYLALPRGQATPRPFHDRERVRDALLALNDFGRTAAPCFLHGDFHLGNLYFDVDGTPSVLDWQSYGKGHWAHDVSYFMVSALSTQDRRAHEETLLSHYLENLAALGGTPPSFSEAFDAYRRFMVYGLFYWLVNPPDWQAEENNVAVAPRFAAAILDHGFDLVMQRPIAR